MEPYLPQVSYKTGKLGTYYNSPKYLHTTICLIMQQFILIQQINACAQVWKYELVTELNILK